MPLNQKRSFQELESILAGIKAIVLDIEGTITPISFVKVKFLFDHMDWNCRVCSWYNTFAIILLDATDCLGRSDDSALVVMNLQFYLVGIKLVSLAILEINVRNIYRTATSGGRGRLNVMITGKRCNKNNEYAMTGTDKCRVCKTNKLEGLVDLVCGWPT